MKKPTKVKNNNKNDHLRVELCSFLQVKDGKLRFRFMCKRPKLKRESFG